MAVSSALAVQHWNRTIIRIRVSSIDFSVIIWVYLPVFATMLIRVADAPFRLVAKNPTDILSDVVASITPLELLDSPQELADVYPLVNHTLPSI
jgi:hypothetical protein